MVSQFDARQVSVSFAPFLKLGDRVEHRLVGPEPIKGVLTNRSERGAGVATQVAKFNYIEFDDAVRPAGTDDKYVTS